jgi:hypothetical protein
VSPERVVYSKAAPGGSVTGNGLSFPAGVADGAVPCVGGSVPVACRGGVIAVVGIGAAGDSVTELVEELQASIEAARAMTQVADTK